jgi:hypothetical protein
MTTHVDRAQLRNFGLIVGGVFGLLGLWPLLILAVALIVPAQIVPRVLAPAHRAWMALGSALGWVNTRIILGLVFFGMITPIGFMRRAIGGDPMQRAFDAGATSYRVPQRPRPGTHMRRQF